jgi:Family of unknown function (DUF6069)
MNTASTISSSTPDAAARSRSTLRVGAIGALAATVANVALWAFGRAADVGFMVSPIAGPPVMQVGVVEVALTTLLTFATGWAVLALGARRSCRWVRVVMVAAAVIAVVSAAGPLSAAQDTATGALLAAMHLVTGATFVATAVRVSARWPASPK